MSLTTNEKQSLSDQLCGTGGWGTPTNKRAAEIKAILDGDEEEKMIGMVNSPTKKRSAKIITISTPT